MTLYDDRPGRTSPSPSWRMTRRAVLRFAVLGATGTILAACGSVGRSASSAPPAGPSADASSRPAPATASAGSAAKPSAPPKTGGTLRTALTADLPSLEVHILLPNEYENLWLVYDRLVAYDDSLKPQPQLAESWDVGTDYKQIKLSLRKGVQFHSGREFTSDDVKYNLLRVRDRTIGAGTFTNQSLWFTTIDTPDKYTVVLGSDQPRPLVFDFFEYFNIVDKATVEGPDAKSKALGTGPFSLTEWVQGDHLSFAKNKNYWQAGRPYLDGMRVNILRDAAAMVAQLEAGALDVIKSPTLIDFVRLKADSKYHSIVHPNSGLIDLIGVNVQNAPLDNKVVRQALSYALDRKRFVDTVFQGIGRAQSLPWPPSSTAYDASKDAYYAFDLDKAKNLLASAHVSGLNFDILLNNSAEGTSLAQIYQADLAKIGVTLNIKPLDSAVWLDQVNNRKYNGVYWASAARANLLPGTILSSSRGFDPVNNNSGFKSDAYTQLVTLATSEPDPAKQKQAYTQLNDLLLDESFFISVSPAPTTALARANVNAISPSALGGFDYSAAWLE